MNTIAADLGGTRIKFAVMRDNAILAYDVIAARLQEGLAPQLPRLAEAIKALCARAGLAPQDFSAIGLSFPSIVEAGTGRILDAYAKYEDALRLDLVTWAQRTFGLPLAIENDARVALLGEWRAGAGRGSDDVVMLTLGTGLGTAAIIGGRLLRGKHCQAGVLGGHSTVRYDGVLCACGNTGCAETEASTRQLAAIAAASPAFADSALKNEPQFDYQSVFRLARLGDACAVSLRARSICVWASVIVSLIHAYDPDTVVVGGGIMAGEADFFEELTAQVHARAHTPWGRVRIARSELGDAAALVGCAVLVQETLSGQ